MVLVQRTCARLSASLGAMHRTTRGLGSLTINRNQLAVGPEVTHEVQKL